MFQFLECLNYSHQSLRLHIIIVFSWCMLIWIICYTVWHTMVIPLWQHSQSHKIWSVCFEDCFYCKIAMTTSRCSWLGDIHAVNLQLLFWLPSQLFINFSYSCLCFCLFGILSDEPTIVIAKVKPILCFEKVIQPPIDHLLPAPISNSVNLILIHRNAVCSFTHSQLSYRFFVGLEFLWVQIHSWL